MHAGVPETPTGQPPTTASQKFGLSHFSFWNTRSVAAKGAISLQSRAVVSPLLQSHYTRNAPQPIPEFCDSTKPRIAGTATIASAAMPPSDRTRAPTAAVRGLATKTITCFEKTRSSLAFAFNYLATSGKIASKLIVSSGSASDISWFDACWVFKQVVSKKNAYSILEKRISYPAVRVRVAKKWGIIGLFQ